MDLRVISRRTALRMSSEPRVSARHVCSIATAAMRAIFSAKRPRRPAAAAASITRTPRSVPSLAMSGVRDAAELADQLPEPAASPAVGPSRTAAPGGGEASQ